MRITESQLRRIIRQEVGQLTEMPRRAAGAPGTLDRLFKKNDAYAGGPSTDDYEARMFRREMTKIADMMGAPDADGLKVSEDPKVADQVVVSPGRATSLGGGWIKARAGTLLGDPVVLTVDEDGNKTVYKWIAGGSTATGSGLKPAAGRRGAKPTRSASASGSKKGWMGETYSTIAKNIVRDFKRGEVEPIEMAEYAIEATAEFEPGYEPEYAMGEFNNRMKVIGDDSDAILKLVMGMNPEAGAALEQGLSEFDGF